MSAARKLRRIGIFGGSFDPPHTGHLIIAEQARQQMRLDAVFFVPAYAPPHKQRTASTSPAQRLAMTRLAVKGALGLTAIALEIERKGISYTVDTLRQLKKMYVHAEFFLIVGGDNYKQIDSWKSIDEILSLTTVIVYNRSESVESKRQKKRLRVIRLHGVLLHISSTMIRHRVSRGESIRYLVPREIERYIQRHGLYRQARIKTGFKTI
jgi:nicotinate-nucleotide adenylyltransferase